MQLQPPVPDLESPRILLRRPIPSDVDARLSIGRHREVVEAYGLEFDPAIPFTRSDAEAVIARIADQDFAWVIDVGGFIGHVRLHSVDLHDKRASLAIGIEDPDYHGKGLGTEPIKLVLGYAFSAGIHRIALRVLETNKRAIASYLKCGFIVEGREREACLMDGVWKDDIMMGLLDREFAAQR